MAFWLMGLTAGSAVVTNGWGTRSTIADPELKPKIMGWDANLVMGVAGVAGVMFGGPLLAAVGMGLVAGSVSSFDTGRLVKVGLDEIVKASITRQQDAAVAQIPGGAMALPGPILDHAPAAAANFQAASGAALLGY